MGVEIVRLVEDLLRVLGYVWSVIDGCRWVVGWLRRLVDRDRAWIGWGLGWRRRWWMCWSKEVDGYLRDV